MDLKDVNSVFVAPADGQGGVGDYSEDFIQSASRLFRSSVQIRTAGPGKVGIRDLRRYKSALRQALKDSGPRPVVHFELSAGGLGPFWLVRVALRSGALVTATVHDPPHSVWWPFRTRAIAAHRVLNHGIHYPLRSFNAGLERRQLTYAGGSPTLFALSTVGARKLRETFPGTVVRETRHYIPSRPKIPEAVQRPLAIGLFGHAYRGKGFDQLIELRAQLPKEIRLIVAGRGTQHLDPVDGVEILGPVDGEEEAKFFASIRAVVLPYANMSRYGEIYSVSGVAARAFAFETPVVATSTGTLPELASEGGMVAVLGGISPLAEAVTDLVTSDSKLNGRVLEIRDLANRRGIDEVRCDFVEAWQQEGSS